MSDLSFDIMDVLHSPLILHDSSWADCIPKRIKDLITPARMIAALKKEELATYPECVCFLMSRSMIAPMSGEWTDIYTYVCCKVCEDHFKENRWDEVKAPRSLSNYLQQQLDGLRRHIYNSRRKALKEKQSESRKREKAEAGVC